MILMEYMYENCKPNKSPLNYVANYSSIHLIVSGSGVFNGKRLSAGEGFTVLENEYVSYYPDKDDPWTYIWINFKDDAFLLSSGILSGDRTFLWKNDVDGLKEKIDELKTKDILYQIGKIYILLSKIERTEKQLPVFEQRINEIKDYLSNYFNTVKSLDGVAKLFGISRAYMRNLFVRYYGISPQEYLIRLRLERAKSLLKTNIPINTVAVSVGYDDQLQFSKLFKKRTGLSPTKYRKKALAKNLINGYND